MTHHLDPIADFDRWLLTDAGRTWRALHPPIAGADDDPVDDPADPPADDPVDDPADPAADDPVDDPADDPADPPADDAAKLRKELATAKARAAQAEREAKRLKTAEERRKREQQAQDGQYETLYNEEKAKREQLEQQMQKKTLRAATRDWAGRLNFRNPALAADLVKEELEKDLNDLVDPEDLEVDEAAVERALKALAKKEPYMVRPAKQQTTELNGNRRSKSGGAAPPATDDPTNWNPAETMRKAYAGSET